MNSINIEKPRLLALYLPQYHPVPENNNWWGKGFTEWTNVGKAKQFFRGHYQPRVPADLGYYDLRVSETREAQARMAKEHGIEGFVYWHYWFGNGKRLLERPFNEVLKSGNPDFPFALAWANESWKGFPHGLKNRNTLIEQKYGGIQDYTDHFYSLLPAFKDKRYIRVDGKLFFMILKPLDSPEVVVLMNLWRELARENNLEGFHFVGHNNSNSSHDEILKLGFDAINPVRLRDYMRNYEANILSKVKRKLYTVLFQKPNVYLFSKVSKFFIDPIEDSKENVYPSIITGWDHTPRSGKDGMVLSGMNPENFKEHVAGAIDVVKDKKNKIIIVKSWNEWAEGNYLEPDLRWGTEFLKVIKKCLSN